MPEEQRGSRGLAMNEAARGDKSGSAVLPVRAAEIDLLEAEVGRLRRQEIRAEEFRSFRLKQGVYGQRQPDQQMIRVKLPFGGLTSDQLEVLGEIAERYSTGRGHVTTRQNVQFHFLRLEQVPQVLRMLAAAGLTTREAGGNQVRNVTACALAGVCPKEVFDVTPYAAAFARYFLRHPLCDQLPRKFKAAFSGCEDDCALSSINDLGFVAAKGDGSQRQGFRVAVGGGLSTLPRWGQPLYPFVPVDDLLRLSQAVIGVFDRLGERRHRNRARLKFLLARVGIEGFRRLVEGEVRESGGQPPPEVAALTHLEAEGPGDPRPAALSSEAVPGFSQWRASNVVAQRQAGYCAAFVTLPLGDISAQQFRSLAAIAREFSGGRARTTVEQGLVLRWVREGDLLDLYRALERIGLAEARSELGADITACPGTDSCSLGITSSRGLARAIAERLRGLNWRRSNDQRISIKISGCPNSCGQHHLGNIGLHGAATHHHGLQVPSCELFLGGNVSDEGVRLGERVTKIIAKKAPEALVALLELYRREGGEDESFVGFIDRYGLKEIAKSMAPYGTVGSPEEEPDCYRDWGATKQFVVERGEGECAA